MVALLNKCGIKGDGMDISQILHLLVDNFSGIRGIDAIVLGGSHSTDTQTDTSDIDIGVYYSKDFDLNAFKSAAVKVDDRRRTDCITDLGEWGPWINGGGWLTVNSVPVDILLRDVDKVSRCIDSCMVGNVTIDYQCGHPFGFVNAIYMGEVYHCKVVYRQSAKIDKLKEKLLVFPQRYKAAALAKFLWESEFSINCGKATIIKGDVLYASGSLFRSAVCLIQSMYAYNEMYCLNEKGSLARLVNSGVSLPTGFSQIIESSVGVNKDNLLQVFEDLENLHYKVKEICTS